MHQDIIESETVYPVFGYSQRLVSGSEGPDGEEAGQVPSSNLET